MSNYVNNEDSLTLFSKLMNNLSFGDGQQSRQ